MSGAIVQTAYGVDDSGASSTSISATLTGVTAGNHIVAFVGWGDPSGSITASVSDGTAFSVGDAKRRDTVNTQSSEVFYRENVGAGSHTVTATFSTSEQFRRIRVCEVSGLATASSLDQATGQFQSSPGTAANGVSSGASTATTNANDLVMGFTQDTSQVDPGTGTLTAGTGYSISGANIIMGVESKNVAATGAQTATFTQSVNNTRTTHVVAFKQTAGGDVSVSLTGSAATSGAGTIKSAIDQAPTGQAATASAGTITAAVSQTLSGAAATASAGSLASDISVALTGSVATFAQGMLTGSSGGDVSVSLTGSVASMSAGSLVSAVAQTLTGTAATTAAGTLASSISQALTGSAATTAQGSITPAVAQALTGQVATGAQGTLTAVTGIFVQLTGSAATFAQGSLTSDLTAALTGEQANFQQGSVGIDTGTGETDTHDGFPKHREYAQTQVIRESDLKRALKPGKKPKAPAPALPVPDEEFDLESITRAIAAEDAELMRLTDEAVQLLGRILH